MKNLFFVLALGATVLFTACGDDEDSNPSSSATLTINNTSFDKTSDFEVTFSESLVDNGSFAIDGEVANGGDTIDFSITIPELAVANYTKAVNGEDADIIIFLDTAILSSSPVLLFDDTDDLSDYALNITSVTENTITGSFEATLQESSTDVQTLEVSGEFVAVEFDLSSLFQ